MSGTRGISTQLAAALADGSIQPFWLLELGFASGTDYVCGLDFDVAWSGHTYLRGLGLLSVSEVEDTGNSQQGLRVQLAGAPTANVSLALSERVQGRPITLRAALLAQASAVQWLTGAGLFANWITSSGAGQDWGGATTMLVDANVWSGTMDTLALDDSGSNPIVTLTAEHMLATWDRPRRLLYTPAQQLDWYPGDLGLEYVPATSEAQVVWPGKAFDKK